MANWSSGRSQLFHSQYHSNALNWERGRNVNYYNYTLQVNYASMFHLIHYWDDFVHALLPSPKLWSSVQNLFNADSMLKPIKSHVNLSKLNGMFEFSILPARLSAVFKVLDCNGLQSPRRLDPSCWIQCQDMNIWEITNYTWCRKGGTTNRHRERNRDRDRNRDGDSVRKQTKKKNPMCKFNQRFTFAFAQRPSIRSDGKKATRHRR